MRFFPTLLTSAGMLVATAATAMAAPLAILQDATLKIDVQTSPTHTVWYTSPMWLAIGGIVVLLVIVLAIFATRGRDGTTTVIK
jgi:hypothetical protein